MMSHDVILQNEKKKQQTLQIHWYINYWLTHYKVELVNRGEISLIHPPSYSGNIVDEDHQACYMHTSFQFSTFCYCPLVSEFPTVEITLYS